MSQTAKDIQQRCLRYSVRAVKPFRHIQKQKDGAALILGRQYLRSATSIGANLLEAQAGESRRDFIHKCSIAQKEAREAKYWLSLMIESDSVAKSSIENLLDETTQILAIVTAILVKTKRNQIV